MRQYRNSTSDEKVEMGVYTTLHSMFALVIMAFAGYTGFTGIAHVFEFTMSISLVVALLGAAVAVVGVLRRR